MRLALLRCASDMTMAARPCGAWTGARVAARRRRAGRLRRRAVAGRLRRDGLDPLDDLGEALASLIAGAGGEDAADRGGDHRLLALGAVAEHVAQEMHRAALPGAAEHL